MQTNNLPLKIALHFSFLVVGIVTFILGSILPIIAKRLSLNDEQAGFFSTSQFFGSIIGTIMTAFLIRKIGFIKTVGVGFLLFIVGLSGVNLNEFWLCWTSVCLYGIGYGLLIPSTLMLTAALNPVKTTSALNLMSAFWAIGAVVCQPFVSLFGRGELAPPTFIIVSFSVVFALLYLIVFRNLSTEQNEAEEDRPAASIWRDPRAWLIVAFGLFDVGIESGVGIWLFTYTFRSDLPKDIWWFSATPIFFSCFAIGRALASLLARFWSNNQIIWVSLAITLLGTILLIFSTGWQLIFLSAAILGFGLAAVFPTNMARFTETFGPEANKQTVPLFVMGSVGSMLITSLIGYFSEAYQSLSAGLTVLMVAAVILLLLQTSFQIIGKSQYRER